jgi:F-type H+-transporting ATPase subunit gamma
MPITRAMKMVAGARLNRAQARIQALRPYAITTGEVLSEVTKTSVQRAQQGGGTPDHPLLVHRDEKNVLIVVVSSDRGLCGAFNSSILRQAEKHWHACEAAGKKVQLATVGRKARDFFRRRQAPLFFVFEEVWEDLGLASARKVAEKVLEPYLAGKVDAVYLVYNEFKSAMSQEVVTELLFPLKELGTTQAEEDRPEWDREREFLFEPDRGTLLEVLVPMYIEVTLYRALLESMASELGARMTAMDAATKNANEVIERLTLQYNRARQAAITTELMEIIGGAEALNG